MEIRTLFSAIVLSVVVCSSASSQTYTLGFDQSRYDVAVGTLADLDLILTEEITSGQTSRLAAGGNDGLFGFSADIDYTTFNGAARGVSFFSFNLEDEFTTEFADSGESITLGPSNVSFEGTEDFVNSDSDMENGVGGMMISENVYAIQLATIKFNADIDDTATLVELGPHLSAEGIPFLFADTFVADIKYTPSQIVVGDDAIAFRLSVPEPNSGAILALLAGTGFLNRRKI